MPRSLKTQGSRALGRLAFTDNYLRLLARLQPRDPAGRAPRRASTSRSARPAWPCATTCRASTSSAGASGGGSGFLADLGYAVRRLLQAAAPARSAG